MADVMKSGFAAGASEKLNRIMGVSSILTVAADETAENLAKVLPAGLMICFKPTAADIAAANGPVGDVIAISDGVKTLAQLKAAPVVDEVLLHREKVALDLTFGGDGKGDYAPIEGGLLVLGEDGKMNSVSMPANIWDEETGKVLLSALPDSVRAGITYVNTIDERDAFTASDEATKGLVFVVNAAGSWVEASDDEATVKASDDHSGHYTVDGVSVRYARVKFEDGKAFVRATESDEDAGVFKGDETVDNGAAMYAYKDGEWTKIAEVESLDIDTNALKPTYKAVQDAGAVMYDHTLLMQAPSITEYFALQQ